MKSGLTSNLLPNLIVIGVYKSGTTSLFSSLSEHPEIYPSRKKEIHHYFPLVYNTGEPLQSLERYAYNFKGAASERYRLEASPSYFYGGEAVISKMKEQLEEGHRIILILRNPIERFVSYFRFIKSRGIIKEEVSFCDFLAKSLDEDDLSNKLVVGDYKNSIKEGLYSKFISSWIKEYDSSKLKILFLDDFKAEPNLVMSEVYEWLGLDDFQLAPVASSIKNKTVMPKNYILQKIAVLINKKLEYFFRVNPRLKHILKAIYLALNGDTSYRDDILEEDIVVLRKIYDKHNAELRLILNEVPGVKLPKWIE